MKLKWQWFLGGRCMFWIAIVTQVILALVILMGYVVDPLTTFSMNEQEEIDPTPIKNISNAFVASYDVKIDKPVVYRFVKFTCNQDKDDNPAKEVLLGTFHEWNSKYYIDISADLNETSLLNYVVIHETKHLLVQQMKTKKIIDLTKYTEEIARGNDSYYNELFDGAVHLLKLSQKENEL